jgi:hypothetical protein
VQQAGFTDTSVVVRSLRSRTKPVSASRRRWCEQVDWLIPSCAVSSPTVTARPAVATACSSRTRIGSARQANQSA